MTKGDELLQKLNVKENQVLRKAIVVRSDTQEEIQEDIPILLFEGTNYLSTNYPNALLSVTYLTNIDENNYYLNNATYLQQTLEKDREDSLVLEAITNTEGKRNLTADNLNVTCITSKENNFSLDQDGNLIVKSIQIQNQQSLDLASIYDAIYPIGSLYLSISNTNPQSLFGGSWERITGYYLYAGEGGNTTGSMISGSPNTNVTGSTAITINQMPNHTHTQKAHNHAQHKDTWMNKTPIDKYVGSNSGFYAQSGMATYYTNNTTAVNNNTGGGEGHTHTLNSHTHPIEPLRYEIFVWKRIS